MCVPLRGGLEAWTHLLLHGVVGALLVGLLQQLVQILHRPRRLLSRRHGIQQARRDLGAAARRKVGSSLCVRALGKWEGVALMGVAGTRRERRTRTPNPPGAGADAPALSDAADCRLPMVVNFEVSCSQIEFDNKTGRDTQIAEPRDRPVLFALCVGTCTAVPTESANPCVAFATAPGTEPSLGSLGKSEWKHTRHVKYRNRE